MTTFDWHTVGQCVFVKVTVHVALIVSMINSCAAVSARLEIISAIILKLF